MSSNMCLGIREDVLWIALGAIPIFDVDGCKRTTAQGDSAKARGFRTWQEARSADLFIAAGLDASWARHEARTTNADRNIP